MTAEKVIIPWKEITENNCRSVLRKNHKKFVKDLDIGPMVNELFSEEVITEYNKKEIEACKTESEARNLLLDRLRHRGKRAFKVFVDALLTTEQLHLYSQVVADLQQQSVGTSSQAQEQQQISSTVTNSRSRSAPAAQKASKPTSGNPKLHVAVQLFMSFGHTHLEVQVVFGNDAEALREWHLAWRHQNPEGQCDMPEPRPITAPYNIPSHISARLTSVLGDTGQYQYGCEAIPPRALIGITLDTLHIVSAFSWLFDLAGLSQSESRTFSLELYTTPQATSLGRELFEKFTFPDHDGSWLIKQLGFTSANRDQCRSTEDSAKFLRSPFSGGVHTASVFKKLGNCSNSVGAIVVDGGEMLGTGFCVGLQEKKCVMTCNHVIDKDIARQAIGSGKLCIIFGDSLIGMPAYGKKCTIKECIASSQDLDYVLLTVTDCDEMNLPPPMQFCQAPFEKLQSSASATCFTIIGYVGTVLTVDTVTDWVVPSRRLIDMAKAVVAEKWPNSPQYEHEYEAILGRVEKELFYNVALHRHGSSGSPVFFCTDANELKLVAMHCRGFPKFFHNDSNASSQLSYKYTLEAGVRMSAIYEHLRPKGLHILDGDAEV